MNKSFQNQTATVLDYLQKHGTLSSNEAHYNLSIARLSARISELRKRGVVINSKRINTVNQFGYPTHYSVYSLAE